VNFDVFMLNPRRTARITRAAKLESSSKDRYREQVISHMLAVLRRYTRAQEKHRTPHKMIDEFKAAAGGPPQQRPRPAADENERPTVN
jgi:hypothetical protein